MNNTKDLINENNYILREIKEIKRNSDIIAENFEIEEDLTIIHEIKNFKPVQIQEKKCDIMPKSNIEIEIRLEGENITKNKMQNTSEKISEQEYLRQNKKEGNLCPECRGENLCPECKGENLGPEYKGENLCPECKGVNLCPECSGENLCPEYKNKNLNIEVLCDECKNIKIIDLNKEKEENIEFGIVDAPFLETKKENVSSPSELHDLMDAFFELLKTDENLKDFDNLLFSFKALKEKEKNEIIEGIKIKIDDEEQEKRFNNLLKYLY